MQNVLPRSVRRLWNIPISCWKNLPRICLLLIPLAIGGCSNSPDSVRDASQRVEKVCADHYEYTDLGTLGGGNSVARAVNEKGQIVGYSNTDKDAAVHATLWANNTAVDLGALGEGQWSKAYAINDRGQVAGTSGTDGNGPHAVLWTDGGIIDLSGSEEVGGAYGINGSGQVVGYSAIDRDNRQSTQHATLWQNGKSIDIDLLAVEKRGRVNASFAYDINDVGEIAMYSMVVGKGMVSSTDRAVVWNGYKSKVLEPLAGHLSSASAINNVGQVAGYSRISPKSFDTHAVLWTNSTALDLGTLGGRNAKAIALSNAGQVVGESETVDGKTHATLWNGDVAVDLNSHLDPDRKRAGWVMERANGINDKGWIIGEAINEQLKVTRAFLLVPTTHSVCRM